jgi:hypothetical protein
MGQVYATNPNLKLTSFKPAQPHQQPEYYLLAIVMINPIWKLLVGKGGFELGYR